MSARPGCTKRVPRSQKLEVKFHSQGAAKGYLVCRKRAEDESNMELGGGGVVYQVLIGSTRGTVGDSNKARPQPLVGGQRGPLRHGLIKRDGDFNNRGSTCRLLGINSISLVPKRRVDAKATKLIKNLDDPNVQIQHLNLVSPNRTHTTTTHVVIEPIVFKPPPQIPNVSDLPSSTDEGAPSGDEPLDVPEPKASSKTQNSQAIDGFRQIFDHLLNHIIAHEADSQIAIFTAQLSAGTVSNMKCLVKTVSYKHTAPCRHIGQKSGMTRLCFCGCLDAPNKVDQLMRARLFPATTSEPSTVFTSKVLEEFHLHNLESKKAAYDYLGALRRLSDNAFTAEIQNPYTAFLRVVQIWGLLTARKRMGQGPSVDALMPQHPAGSLVVYCPACPQPGFNMLAGFEMTPSNLRHLNQSQCTLDGNFHCNKLKKNTDPEDFSLWDGKGHMPHDPTYRVHITSIPDNLRDEKTAECDYLKASLKQKKAKFAGMDITGTVNCQCGHVFILSCTDLQGGEKLKNVDYALAHALQLNAKTEELILYLESEGCDNVATYDLACQYGVNLISRFKEHHPDLVSWATKIRWGIPACHIPNHTPKCQYEFSTAYLPNFCHFHGEMVEHYWAEANQLGGHVWQMNNGRRQDTLNDHHGDWNWKKTEKMAQTLQSELTHARAQYVLKRDHFRKLTATFGARTQEWNKLSRTFSRKGKEIHSVYHHKLAKAPTMNGIFQQLLSKEQHQMKIPGLPRTALVIFLNEGILIQDAQRRCRAAMAAPHKDHTGAYVAEIKTYQKLAGAPNCEVEAETLWLPSDLTLRQRTRMGLTELAQQELMLREGEAFDALQGIKAAVRALNALWGQKAKDSRGQAQNTRSMTLIHDAEGRRDGHMSRYSASSDAMITLGAVSADDKNTPFPVLTLQDTFRKGTEAGRQIRDSQHNDGKLWTLGGIGAGGGSLSKVVLDTRDPDLSVNSDTDTSAQRSAKPNKDRPEKRVKDDPRCEKSGWIWTTGDRGKISAKEMDEWAEEGDRVQWFRAEAEMQRWQEQEEIKQAEFIRTSNTFSGLQRVWTQLAESQPSDFMGHVAYARKKAAMWDRMQRECMQRLRDAGYEPLRPGESLVDRITAKRKVEDDILKSDDV
ncbi:hypothetical protein OF83DRAFT_1087012 [Amylostereum chailletii]|nr:hypothetical protein OF83DRAFT_1087012 [Amylostereum chailletii]